MVSQATIQTLTSYDVKVLHLESTDVCQASCPACGRETDSLFNKSEHNYLTVVSISNIIDDDVIKNLDKMFMCGDYGDPAANKHSLDIYRYFRQLNPNIILGMNTNGAIQNTDWWRQLAGILNQQHDYVVFSIDGLKDTNDIYRRGVVWEKLIDNASAFISAGGNAHWDMLVYEHNEHQVELCERLAQEMGFKMFGAKVSKRESPVNWLKHPKGWSRPLVNTGVIDCFVEKEQSIYITAKGELRPCCWHGFSNGTSLEEFPLLKQTWTTSNHNPICKRTCTKSKNVTPFNNQWQRKTVF